MLTTFNDDPDLFEKVITGDESILVFPKLTPLTGKRFATIDEIKEKSKQELLAIPKSAIQECFED